LPLNQTQTFRKASNFLLKQDFIHAKQTLRNEIPQSISNSVFGHILEWKSATLFVAYLMALSWGEELIF